MQPLWKTVWNFLRKLEMDLPFNPVIPLLGLNTKDPESPVQKNLCTPMFIAALFTLAKCWKQPKCPRVHEWTKKLWYIYTMEFFAAERKKELLPSMTAWMELESIDKWNKPDGEREIPYDLTYKWNLINKTSKQNTNRDIEIKNKPTVTRDVGREG